MTIFSGDINTEVLDQIGIVVVCGTQIFDGVSNVSITVSPELAPESINEAYKS